jgi:hypothetical protein
MVQRVTEKMLDGLADRLNKMHGYALELGTRQPDGEMKWNPNVFHIDRAYNGFGLFQQAENGTGSRDVLYIGHTTKRELYHAIFAYIKGIQDTEDRERIRWDDRKQQIRNVLRCINGSQPIDTQGATWGLQHIIGDLEGGAK